SAPILTSEGRSFEVARHWLDQPIPKTQHFETGMANLILHALSEEDGSLLAFLPGEGEIRRTQAVLQDQLPPDVQLRPLYGAMDFKAQRAALEPTISGRKIVLATSIAETSLTIEGVRIVVDGGRARRSEFDPSSGMSRLVTTRVSRAEAAQRAGRAGRIAPGSCFKLWTRGEDGALPAYPPAEIDVEDLARLSLEVALWGGQPQEMSFLTPPHAGRLADAQRLLQMLKALDDDLRITDHGRALAKLPLHPRLAHMVSLGGRNAARLAALLSERDILQGAPADLKLRLEALARPKVNGGIRQPALSRVREEIRRLEKSTNRTGPQDPAVLAALAYPDRIGLRRLGDAPRFVLSGGKGAYLSGSDPLAGTRMLVATDLDGDPREARIRQAIAFSEAALRECFPDQIIWQRTCAWSRRTNRVEARQQETFGALVLEDRVWQGADPLDVSRAMLDGVRHLGLAPSPSAERLIARVNLMRQYEPDFPDFGADNLMATLEDWLLPHLSDVTTSADWRAFDILPALEAHLGWDALQSLNRAVPAHFITPLGRKIPIDYNDAQPQIAVRLQELFGTTRHPTVAGTPVQITLLSPAQRPLQVTTDLPGFWASSYADVRKDMRGRYPKHPWPEDPTMADPTLRAKPRK
ncbi:MAG: ATP-dependent helicase HrpB, partial [Pseudomonadota bacterium]